MVRATGGGAKSCLVAAAQGGPDRHPGRGASPRTSPGRSAPRSSRASGPASTSRSPRPLTRSWSSTGGSSPTRFGRRCTTAFGTGSRRRRADAKMETLMTEPAGALPPFSTPALIVDLDVFEANVGGDGDTSCTVPARRSGRTSRRIGRPELARRQLGGSAVGITCATVGEAEAMVGGRDRRRPRGERDRRARQDRAPGVSRPRCARRCRRRRPGPGRIGSRAPPRLGGVTIDVLIDVDIGLHRCGVASAEEAVALARGDRAAPGAPARRDHGL